MNYGSALEVLGVADDDELTRDQLRRVYMRKLRQHPPEKDPEGFRRLREAFEYLREWIPEDRGREEREQPEVWSAGPAAAPDLGIVVIDVSGARPAAAAAADVHQGKSSDAANAEERAKQPHEPDDGREPDADGDHEQDDAHARDPDDGDDHHADRGRDHGHDRAHVDHDDEGRDEGAGNVRDAASDEDGDDDGDDEPANLRGAASDEDIDDDGDDEPANLRGAAGDEDVDDDERDEAGAGDDDDIRDEQDDAFGDEEDVDDDERDEGGDSADDGPRFLRELPRMSELPPLASMATEETPSMPLDRLVETLLVMLEHEELVAALELSARWQATGDTDDRRYATDYTAARWALTRELLGAAPELPPPVTTALARAISRDNVESAREELEAYRRRDPDKARAANTVLASVATMLHRQVESALYSPPPPPPAPPPPRIQFKPPPSYQVPNVRPTTSRGSPAWAIIIVGIACIRLCMSLGDSTSSSRYKLHDIKLPEIPKFDYKIPNIDYAALSNINLTPAEPKAFDPHATRTDMLVDVSLFAGDFPIYELGTLEQDAAARDLGAAALGDDCPRMRKSLAALEAAPSRGEPAKRDSAERYIAGMKQRVDVLCPAKTSPKKRKKSP